MSAGIFPYIISLSPSSFFFFNDTATTEIYTLSLHDALPIFRGDEDGERNREIETPAFLGQIGGREIDRDRKSTRLNSSHVEISYAVFCLKKKKKKKEKIDEKHNNK